MSTGTIQSYTWESSKNRTCTETFREFNNLQGNYIKRPNHPKVTIWKVTGYFLKSVTGSERVTNICNPLLEL